MAGELALGPVLFQDFEVPERLRFGGRQRLAVHVLPGGGRVVDAMGADEAPLEWSGVFSGPAAADRVRLLESLRRLGAVLLLAWEGWRYTVIIEAFEAEATNPAWIPYRLRVCVVVAGDLAVVEPLPVAPTMAEAAALGAGPGLGAGIVAATAALQSNDIAVAIAASGTLAQLITAQAFVGKTS